jgi:hypothetical protein
MATIKPERKEALLNTLIQDIENSKWFETDIEPFIIERCKIQKFDEDYYNEKFPELSKDCRVTSPSVWDAIERKCASLIKVFHSTLDVVRVTGHPNSKNMQEVINHFTRVVNRGLLVDYQWFKDAFINLKGLIKVSWVKEYEKQTVQGEFTTDEIDKFKQEGAEVKLLSTVPYDPISDPYMVNPVKHICEVSKEVLVDDYPKIENMSASEFRWDKHAKTIKDAYFTNCRKTVTIDYLRKNIKKKSRNGTESGMYEKDAVERVASGEGEETVDTNLEQAQKTMAALVVNNDNVPLDDPARTVQINECRRYFDIDGDGKLEFVLVTISNKVMLRIEILDKKDRHPIFDISPTIDTQRVWPEKGMIDAAAQYQHAETALVRQSIIAVAKGNRPQTGVDSTKIVDYDQLIEGAEYIEINGDPHQALFPLVIDTRLAGETLPLIQYCKDKFEAVTATTAYSMGQDSPTMNNTATGVSILTQQANMPIDLYARIFGETGKLELMKYLGYLIQNHLENPVEIPVQDGDPKVITREMLQGNFTYVIDNTLGTGVKEQMVQIIGQMLVDYPALIQAGIANEMNVYNAKKRQLEEAGIKNTDEFLLPEEQIKQMMAAKQQQGQMPPQAHWSENMKIDFATLPDKGKAFICQQLGIPLQSEDFAQQAAATLQQSVTQDANKHLGSALEKVAVSHLSKERSIPNNGQTTNQANNQGQNSNRPQQNSGVNQQGPPGQFGQ